MAWILNSAGGGPEMLDHMCADNEVRLLTAKFRDPQDPGELAMYERRAATLSRIGISEFRPFRCPATDIPHEYRPDDLADDDTVKIFADGRIELL